MRQVDTGSADRSTRPGGAPIRIVRLRRGDTDSVEELFDALSPRSRLQRFLSPVQRLTPQLLDRLADVDDVTRVAVTARAGGRCVGIARAAAVPGRPGTAEVAVAVADDLQGTGLGRLLVDRVSAEAACRGMRVLEGHVLPGNRAALALGRAIGATLAFDEGLVRMRWTATGCA
jgi:GNAT superfamily N-acetyltransferase